MKSVKEERRKSKRTNIWLCPCIVDYESASKPQKADLSDDGAFLLTNRKYKVGKKLVVVLSDPKVEISLALKAEVVRVSKGRDGWKWGVGVEFYDVPPRERELLREIRRKAKFTLPSVLVAVRDKALLGLIKSMLHEGRYDITTIGDLKDLKKVARKEDPTLVIAEVEGTEKELSTLGADSGDASVLVISNKYGPDLKASAGTHGIFECVRKPVNTDDLVRAVRQGVQAYRIEQESIKRRSFNLKLKTDKGLEDVPEIVGRRGAMARVNDEIRLLSEIADHVLIIGETGVGKEVAAKRIHLLSKRNKEPFIVANMGEVRSEDIEGYLFGVEKRKFTEVEGEIGCVERAEGGTLFIDEVQLVPLSKQRALLRLIAEREYKKVGATETLKANVRIIVATNQDLQVLVEGKKFREDLFYRLNVRQLRIPPLRERSEEDRHELVLQIIRQLNEEFGTRILKLGEKAQEKLVSYTWPGNVRELINALRRSVQGKKGDTLQKLNLGPDAVSVNTNSTSGYLDYKKTWPENRRIVVDHCEGIYCGKIYKDSEWNAALAAKRAGISREKFYEKLRKHGHKKPKKKPDL
jgi:DNA-binding NtrC family response regulator